jgi:tRNA(Arg) A34 adenosine deaminase TadA
VKGCDIFVVRTCRSIDIDQQRLYCNSKPCSLCAAALKKFGIHRVYYSINNSSDGLSPVQFEKCKVRDLQSEYITKGQLMLTQDKDRSYRSTSFM